MGAEPDRLALLDRIYPGLTGFALPELVCNAVARMRAEPVPPLDRPLAMSHNDVNPTNIAFDGNRIVLLDWDTAAPSDVYYDLAAIAPRASRRPRRRDRDETLANTPGLAELFPPLRDGSLNPGSPAGQWVIGLALFVGPAICAASNASSSESTAIPT